ncbi:MAG TPA: hypothetical protein P5338_00145 [Bacteroidales bacterium]|nr:hypothetical protein [Bacteroidales bacterium]
MKEQLWVLFLLVPAMVSGQVTVKGIVTEQNSGNRPLAGVQIKALGSTPELTDQSGQFRLTFGAKKPGDRIVVSEISKKGYEIVNKDVVNNWMIPSAADAKTKIVMCPEGLIAANTLKYYNISFDGLAMGYNEQIRKCQEEKEKALIDAKTYGEKLKLLSEQFENQQNVLEELAERFARENFDDCSEVHKKAFEAYQAGNINEAIRILETVNSTAEIEKAKKQYAEAEKLKSELEQVQAFSDSVIRQNIRKLLFQADLYASELRFEDAKAAYEAAVNADTTDFQSLFDFVIFLFDQKEFDSAMKWCTSALGIAKTRFERAQALRFLANTQASLLDYENAEKNFNQAIELLTGLVDESPEEYSYILLLALQNISVMHLENQHYADAKQYLTKALQLTEKYNQTPEGELAMKPTLCGNLGFVYLALTQPDSAEFWLTSAIQELSVTNDTGSISGKNSLAMFLNTLSQVYDAKREFGKSQSMLLQSLAINRDLVRMNPQRFNPEIVIVLNNLAIAYLSSQDFLNADLYAAEAEGILKELVKANPVIYSPALSSVLNTRAAVQSSLMHTEKAEMLQAESVSCMRIMASVNPLVNRDKLAVSLNNLSVTQKELGKYDEALLNSTEAVDIFLDLEKEYPQAYKAKAARCLEVLARLNYVMQDFRKSEENYRLSIRKFSECSPEMLQYYLAELPDLHKELISLYVQLDQVPKAVAQTNESINFFRHLAEGNPQDYYAYMAYFICELSWLQYKSDLGQAISTMNTAIEAFHRCADSGYVYTVNHLALCYGRMTRYLILNRNFAEAERYALLTSGTDDSEMMRKNIAHALLYNGKYEEAEKIYLELKDKKCECNPPTPFRVLFLKDLDEFEEAGVTHPDVAKIRKQLVN